MLGNAMVSSTSFYSKTIVALKIALPLVALALLSTLFLFARSNDALRDLPVVSLEGGSGEVAEAVEKPVFSGLSSDGDVMRFTADRVTPMADGENHAENLWARLNTSETEFITVTSEEGTLFDNDDMLHLMGRVQITSQDGYVLNTETLYTRTDTVDAETAQDVQGYGPLGTIEAGKMQLRLKNPESTAQHVYMVFTGGVKTVYTPKKDNEGTTE